MCVLTWLIFTELVTYVIFHLMPLFLDSKGAAFILVLDRYRHGKGDDGRQTNGFPSLCRNTCNEMSVCLYLLLC